MAADLDLRAGGHLVDRPVKHDFHARRLSKCEPYFGYQPTRTALSHLALFSKSTACHFQAGEAEQQDQPHIQWSFTMTLCKRLALVRFTSWTEMGASVGFKQPNRSF
jgi:hypothetical protein